MLPLPLLRWDVNKTRGLKIGFGVNGEKRKNRVNPGKGDWIKNQYWCVSKQKIPPWRLARFVLFGMCRVSDV